MQECSQAGSHNGSQFGRSTRPRQLRDREVSWEGSRRSKLMSRRTERPYKVDGAGELAPHSAARRSAPEINGPAVQQKFTFLLRETCSPSPSATVGAVARNGCRAGTGVSRGRSTESNEPGYTPEDSPTREGLNLAGRTRPSMVLSRSVEADWLSFRAATIVAEKECCLVRKDCQEPPYADPHVRWCGSWGEQSPRRPDYASGRAWIDFRNCASDGS